MPILNYTTTIDCHRTVGEVQRLLAKHGARGVLVEYNIDGSPVALAFQVDRNDRLMRYRLPCRYMAVHAMLKKEPGVRSAQRTEKHALNVAWRIVLDWCEAQMALVDVAMASVDEIFLPYALVGSAEGGEQTVYEKWSSTALLAAGGG